MTKLILSTFILLCPLFLFAQDDTYIFIARTKTPDNIYRGYALNEDGEQILKAEYSYVYMNNWGWLVASKDGKKELYRAPFDEKFADGIEEIAYLRSKKIKLLPVKKDGKWGYYNREGELVIEHKFDSATYFSIHLYTAAVKVGEDAYRISMKGERLKGKYTPSGSPWGGTEFEEIGMSVASDLGINGYYKGDWESEEKPDLIEEEGKKGLKNSQTGELIIPLEFDRIMQMDKILDYFIVVKSNKWGIYSLEGEEVVPPTYDRIYLEKL